MFYANVRMFCPHMNSALSIRARDTARSHLLKMRDPMKADGKDQEREKERDFVNTARLRLS